MGGPLFFAEWRPPEDKEKSKYESFIHQVPVIAFNADVTEAIIVHKRAILRVPLIELAFARFE